MLNIILGGWHNAPLARIRPVLPDNGKGESIDVPEIPVILFENGFTVTTQEYADKGMREGWLELIGWNRDIDHMTMRYRMVKIPDNEV